jgi:hypothetical protein
VTRIGARRWYRTVPASREAPRLLATTAVALLTAACSMSFPMASLFDEPAATQSIVPKAAMPLSPELGEEDWRRAKAALAVALDPQGSGTQVSWDNPESALKGSFTPVGQLFVKTDEICRAFLATVESKSSASSLQGSACRPSGGEWAIKDVKAFRKG